MDVATDPVDLLRKQADEIDALKAALSKMERENKRLSDELVLLLRQLFHKKSERLDADQLRLFAEQLLGEPPTGSAPEAEVAEIASYKRRKQGHGRAKFPAHLPRETVEIDLPEADRICPDCGEKMEEFGVETTERGHIIPARILVRQYLRKKYACPCGHCVRMPELPPSLIEKCKYETSVYAHLTVAKYGDQQPLHRLAGIYKRYGFSLPKSTMWEMLARVDEIAGQPIVEQMRRELLMEPVLQADETPVTVQLEDGKGSRKSYIWCYGIGKKRVFDFTLTREREGPKRFLRDWKGTLQTDGYSGYDEVVRANGLVRAGCWSHARRKVKDALDTGSPAALPLMRQMQRLFRIERAMKTRAGDDIDALHALRREIRPRLSGRVLARIRQSVRGLWEERSTLPKSVLGKALTYLDNQRESLTVFVQNPLLEIHNNDCERAIRHVVTGRKNWLFFGSPRGAEVGANLFSLVAACKALDIHPEAYLEDVLARVATTPMSEIARLTPWAWAKEQNSPS